MNQFEEQHTEFTLEDLQTMNEQDMSTEDLDLDDLELDEELDSLDLDDLDDLDDLELDDDDLDLDDLEEELAEIESQEAAPAPAAQEEFSMEDMVNLDQDLEEGDAMLITADDHDEPSSFSTNSFDVDESQESEPDSVDELPSLDTAFAAHNFDDSKFQRYHQLRSESTLLFEGEELNLSHSSDINRIADSMLTLFTQNIEDTMQRLQRIWQSEKQVKELYNKLEQFSRQRAPVSDIIATAQEIAVASGVLDSDSIKSEDMIGIVNKLQSFKAVIERYEHIFSKLSH